MNVSQVILNALIALILISCASVRSLAASSAITVEVFIRTKGGDTVRLSGTRLEVAEMSTPPEFLVQRDLRVLRVVKGFGGIVTDADGKAEIKSLEPNYYVCGIDKRQIVGETERYLWFVPVTEAREGKLLLSNHNMFTGSFEKTLLLTPLGINASDQNGWNSMIYATRAGDKAKVEFLLSSGADVDSRGYDGKTPLFFATTRTMTDFLLAKGADVKAISSGGLTPLHIAAFWGLKDVAESLIAKGADVNAATEEGSVPLHDAALHGKKAIAELLLSKGANVNAKSIKGNTPLHLAASSAHKDIVELLLDAHADVNPRNFKGDTPLKIASDAGSLDNFLYKTEEAAKRKATRLEIVEMLRKHGGE